MRLTGNKEYISYNKVRNRVYWKEENLWNSHNHIWYKQDMNIQSLIQLDYLIDNIYNEINRE
jgi:hypothetical protein